MIRLFVAIDFPVVIKDQFEGLVDDLGLDGYPLVFEKKENFHLTLKFLGWCHDYKLPEVDQAISRAIEGVNPFWFRPTKIGYFLKDSLILWVGVEAQEGLQKLASQLDNELFKIGFAKEKRNFSAHITFARKRRISADLKWQRLAEEIKEKYERSFGKLKVEEILLMQSVLTPKGSIYTLKGQFPFRQN